ncbi:MAG TPA: DUF885 domain-containing protein, partial [Phenylobacterium sp.]|nr:DUF885 domain-containing protein [Phenylobacterium sp.]
MSLQITRRAFAASALALATPLPALAQASETDRLNAFFEEVYQRNLKRSPIAQSRRGLKTDNDKWDDIGEARQQESLRLTKGDLERLRTFDTSKLDPQARLSYRLFERGAVTSIDGFKWRRHDYLITQMGGLHRRVATVLLSNHQVDEARDAEAYVKRLHGVKPLMAALVGELEKQEAAGVKPPKFVYDLTVYEAQNLITGAPFEAGADSPVWADFKAKVGKLTIPEAQKAALVAQGEAGMKEGFGPGYRQLIAHLKAAQATAGEDDGVWHVPEGEAYYRFQLEQYTTLPLTAEQIHETGLKEVARIHEEMRGIMRQVGFTGSLQDFFAFVRTDQQFYYPD